MATFTVDMSACPCCGISTACCPGALIPQTLHITFTGGLTGTYALAWNAGNGDWEVTVVLCNSARSRITVNCNAALHQWQLTIFAVDALACSTGGTRAAGSATCSPLSITWGNAQLASLGGCCTGMTLAATVTA